MANRKFKKDININWEIFRTRLQSLLDSRGITATEFARQVNLSAGTVCRYLYERTPDVTAAWIMADYFGVTVDRLIGRSDNRYSSITEEQSKFIDNYIKATEQDRAIINMILAKYE